MTRLNIIFARSNNGVIGRNNQLPWHLPEDLAHFKRITMGCPIVMGRKTWDSIGRPLPGRTNIVVTRQAGWQATGALTANSLEQAIELADAAPEVYVIGGGELYISAMPLARRAYITEIDTHIDNGDAFAPTLGRDWHEVSRQDQVTAQGLQYSFVTYERSHG